MLQHFHWYTPAGGTLWREVAGSAADLAAAGFSAVWLPPAYKGQSGGYDVGYGVYDMYDLGEFDQKGTVPTKYGTRDEYLAAIAALQSHGIAVFADIVWNHRLGGDRSEVVRATPFPAGDRTHPGAEPREIEAWTVFDFAGRAGVHDARTLDHRHFDAVDFDQRRPDETGMIYLLEGKSFDDHVADEFGNYAYLMGCDMDQTNPEVQQLTIDWGCWYLDTTGVDGLRLDAVKHMPSWTMPLYLDALREHTGREIPAVAEYWSGNVGTLQWYLGEIDDRAMLFDVPLHFSFHNAGRAGSSFDLRTILDGSLVAARHDRAVTFVDNHDSQPMQALQSPLADWFKPLAYALILLRASGFPCVFEADYHGATYTEHQGEGMVTIEIPSLRGFLDTCLGLRRELGDAAQVDAFDHPNVVGWTRHAPGLTVVVLMSNGNDGRARSGTGQPGARFTDETGGRGEVRADADGAADFTCPGRGVSVWVWR